MEPRLRDVYRNDVLPYLMEQNRYSNRMEVPFIERVVINMGLGRLSDAGKNSNVIEEAADELAMITGQRPVITRAKKSIAGFKLRDGLPIGCMVTLRGIVMYEFLDRLFNLALPRVRDFRGVSPKGFDGSGNYTLGIKEHIIFPEIDYSKVQHVKGMNISIVTTTKSDEEARELLDRMGMPFVKN